MTATYWKANKDLSKKIISLLKKWKLVLAKANRIKKEIGALEIYTSNGFTKKYVSGFVFKDEATVDKSLFCRLKGTHDGWKPRSGTSLAKEMRGMESDCVGEIMDLIGMKLLGGGLTVRTPGIDVRKGVVYLTLPSDVKPKECERISDLEFESVMKRKEAR